MLRWSSAISFAAIDGGRSSCTCALRRTRSSSTEAFQAVEYKSARSWPESERQLIVDNIGSGARFTT